jgi:cobalt-zinc-cadmium efflux system protein
MHSHDHDHNHAHSHAGHHHAVSAADVTNRAFIAGIILNSIYVVFQAVAGFMTNSVALLSDAGHNLSDVASLALSLLAFRLAKARPSQSFTYGYKKTTILAALTNAVILLITVGMLGFESVNRILHPRPVEGGIVAIIAGIGVAINLGSAFLFFRNKEHDLNTKGAYLHLLTDALVSLGVVAAGLVMRFTNWYWLDGTVSIVVLLVILIGTWSLLTHSLRLTLDAVPHNVSVEKIERVIRETKGVDSFHHLHIWAMSTTQNALTVHLVLAETLAFDEKMKIVHEVKHELLHQNIHHATMELESADIPCDDANC